MKETKTFVLWPNDTLFFLDGRPFGQDDAGLADASSIFPPYPPVVAGAVRAAMARSLGWDGRTKWQHQDHIGRRLGDGDCLKPLSFRGPFLASFTEKGAFERLLFPAPAAMRGIPDDKSPGGYRDLRRLQPAPSALRSDLGQTSDLWLPLPIEGCANAPNDTSSSKHKDLGGKFVSREFLQKFLKPSFSPEPAPGVVADPAPTELRVGLARERETAKAAEGQLYQAGRRRLRAGYALVVEASDAKQVPIDPASPLPLGGDGRTAFIETIGDKLWSTAFHGLRQPACQAADGDLYYTIVLLTPALADQPDPLKPFACLPGRAVFVAHDRLLPIGGWRLDDGPLATQFALPAGTTLFCRMPAGEMSAECLANWLATLWPKGLGLRTHFGFGVFAHGAWHPVEDTKKEGGT